MELVQLEKEEVKDFMKRLFLLPLLLGLSSPAQAEIDPKVREVCLPAADFLGCVKAYTTNSSEIPNQRVIGGEIELTGNSCPAQHVYSGSGYCTRVVCTRNQWKHHPDLKDKGFKCNWPLKLTWGGSVVKAVSNPSCPDREPLLATNSSCVTKESLEFHKNQSKQKKPLACRNGVWDKNHPKCRDAGITSSMDMD